MTVVQSRLSAVAPSVKCINTMYICPPIKANFVTACDDAKIDQFQKRISESGLKVTDLREIESE